VADGFKSLPEHFLRFDHSGPDTEPEGAREGAKTRRILSTKAYELGFLIGQGHSGWFVGDFNLRHFAASREPRKKSTGLRRRLRLRAVQRRLPHPGALDQGAQVRTVNGFGGPENGVSCQFFQ